MDDICFVVCCFVHIIGSVKIMGSLLVPRAIEANVTSRKLREKDPLPHPLPMMRHRQQKSACKKKEEKCSLALDVGQLGLQLSDLALEAVLGLRGLVDELAGLRQLPLVHGLDRARVLAPSRAQRLHTVQCASSTSIH